MAANINNEYKIFKYYEGLCSSADFPKEVAKVLALGVTTEPLKDIDGNILEPATVIKSKNWDIVYPAYDSSLNIDPNNMTTEEYVKKINNQVEKISDTVILKTKTTPKELTEDEIDDLTVDNNTNKAYLEMYLEIYKPTYIANPEEYPLDCERQGITPTVITKDLYKESMSKIHSTEEEIYTQPICKHETRDDISNGAVEVYYDQCDEYVTKINAIYGSTTFAIPSGVDSTTKITINAAYLAKIKQTDPDLYNLFLKNLNGGEGLEPKEYTLLDHLDVEITKLDSGLEDDAGKPIYVYLINMESTKKLNTYTIAKGSSYTLAKYPDEDPAPEFYLDGIYVPLNPDLYTVSYVSGDTKAQITFTSTVEFEATKEGVLIVRYTYTDKGSNTITERKTLLNNHYVLMRMFDNINDAGDGPAENVYNASGDIIQTNSHISPWSKLSWYVDFEEVLTDSIDSDVGSSNLQDGTILIPLETPGLNSDTKIRYWLNTNNDRFSLIVMGNAALDYSRDRHLTAACYCGRIESFEGSINDTAGNFALFTSSSTEPCNTTLNMEKIMHTMPVYNSPSDFKTIQAYCEDAGGITDGNNSQSYTIQLSDKKYFDRTKWPKYMFVKDGTPVTGLVSAFKRDYVVTDGKADVMEIMVEPEHASFNETYQIYIVFNYYKEKYIITGGVSRDVFGNVIDVAKEDMYGKNTSDGVTSIMMYRTRSNAFYQKHHMLFATTEEYMSKVLYGKSSYTGEYYADRIKVTHGNDGPRGTMGDLLVIDSASLYPMDELVINKDFKKEPEEYEETFVYFAITAPFSPLSDGPNARYGLAIKKQDLEPQYTDEMKLIKIAMNELDTLSHSWWPVDKNIFPRDVTTNGCSVYWKVLDDTAWMGDEDTPSSYSPVKLAVVNTSEYKGDPDKPLPPIPGVVLSPGSNLADETYSTIKIDGFTATDDTERIAYGISDEPIVLLFEGAQAKAVIEDNCEELEEKFEYQIYGVPYTEYLTNPGESLPTTDIKLTDAAPDRYLILYSIKEDKSDVTAEGKETTTISKFSCIPLTKAGEPKNALLQYPCSINAYIEGGRGSIIVDGEEKAMVNTIVDYNSSFELPLLPFENDTISYEVAKVIVTTDEGESEITTFKDIAVGTATYKGITIDSITSDTKIRVQFEVK